MDFSTKAFLLGLPVGFLFSFAMGPIFFMLLQSSLENGLRYAVFMIFGVVVADAVLSYCL
jgi:threonine/homoserine/homoserine lactone efflux protein